MRVIPSVDDLSVIWRLLVVRGGIVLTLGLAALPWPAASITGLVIIMATVVIVAALFDAAMSGGLQSPTASRWVLLPQALLGVLLGGAILLYPLVRLAAVAVLLSVWMLARGVMLLMVARGASSDRVMLTLALGWIAVSVFAPVAIVVHWREATILSIIDTLLAYILVWSALELAIGLRLRSRARRLLAVGG